MNITIYGKPDCEFCELAKSLCESSLPFGWSYRYHDIKAERIDREVLVEKAGQAITTVPVVFVNETFLGGFTQLAEYLDTIGDWDI